MYSAYTSDKQSDNIQPWRTPFPIWNQPVVPCLVLTFASWAAWFLRFLSGQVRWSGIPISSEYFAQFVVIHAVKGLYWPLLWLIPFLFLSEGECSKNCILKFVEVIWSLESSFPSKDNFHLFLPCSCRILTVWITLFHFHSSTFPGPLRWFEAGMQCEWALSSNSLSLLGYSLLGPKPRTQAACYWSWTLTSSWTLSSLGLQKAVKNADETVNHFF